jgi:hypothetical protein
MTRILSALLLVFMAVPAIAQDARAIGFTQDGLFFIVGRYDAIGSDTLEQYVVFDAHLGNDLFAPQELTPEQYKQFVARRPLAPLKTGQQSPDGKRQLQVSSKDKEGRWEKGEFHVTGVSPWTGDSGEEARVPPPSTFRFGVKEGKKTWPSSDFTFEHGNQSQRVEFIWSPDGRRVAYLVHLESATDGGGSDYWLKFGPTQGPRVQVLGVKGTIPALYVLAVSALEKAGLTPISTGEAKDSHPSTVVFAAKGFEADARKAAQALRGATVAPLTWKPGYELVVVLGGK